MKRRILLIALAVLALASAIGAGLLLPSRVAIRPGLIGCSSLKSDSRLDRCMQERAAENARIGQLNVLAKDIDEAGAASTRINTRCHGAMHVVAEKVGRKAASAGDDLPTIGTIDNCSSGLAHGLVIGYLENASWRQLTQFDTDACTASKVNTEPADSPAAQIATFETCLHGVGHRLFQERSDLQEGTEACTDLVASAPVDSELVDRIEVGCIGGMLMERTFDDPDSARTCPDNGASPTVRRLYEACLGYLAINMAQAGASAEDAADRCNEIAPSGENAQRCANGVAQVSTGGTACSRIHDEIARKGCRLSSSGPSGSS